MVKYTIASLLLLGALIKAPVLNAQGLQKLNGTRLYLKVVGNGDPLLVIPGGPGMSYTYFLPHLQELEKKYKVIYYDPRATGGSSIPSPDSISLAFFAADIEAIRQYVGADKLSLLAHSWGALPAIKYATQYPDRINKLILCSAIPLSHEFDTQMLENQKKKMTVNDSTDRAIIVGSRDFKNGKSDAYKKLLMLSFRHSFYKKANTGKLQLTIPSNYKLASQALYTGLAKDMTQYDFYDQLTHTPYPVLIIVGKADVIPAQASAKLQKTIPHATLATFHRSGHFPFIEEQSLFFNTVNKILSIP
jgi:proline iminopeptidase